MKIAALQYNIAWANKPANYATVERYAQEASENQAVLMILPEMFAAGFCMDTSYTAEPADGDTPSFIRTLAKKHHIAVIGGYVQTRPDDLPHNVALVCDAQGKDIACYSKIHLFSYAGEDKVHGKGTDPVVFNLAGVNVACFICYDLRFPGIFRRVAHRAHVMIVIASWPSSRQAHWDVLLRARAVENQCYVIGVNRIGQGGGLSFTGGSVVIDPLGTIIADAGDREALIYADIDPAGVAEIRASFPFLKDR